MHGGPHHLDTERDQRVVVVVERIPKRRREQHGSRRTSLVVVVDDLREPLANHDSGEVLGLRLAHHVEIAVVVVPDVFLVEPGDVVDRAPQRVGLPHVPAGDELHAVGVGVDGEQDHVVQDPARLGIVASRHLVDELHELVLVRHVRVQGCRASLQAIGHATHAQALQPLLVHDREGHVHDRVAVERSALARV